MNAGPTTEGRLMRVSEVAALFDVEDETVRVWVRGGKLKAIRTPGGRGLRSSPRTWGVSRRCRPGSR